MEIKAPSFDPFQSLRFYASQARPEEKSAVILDDAKSPLKLVPTGKPAKMKPWQAIVGYYRMFAGYLGPRHNPERRRHVGFFDLATLCLFYLLESIAGWDLLTSLRGKNDWNRFQKFWGWVAFVGIKLPLNGVRAGVSAVLAIVCAIPALGVVGVRKLVQGIKGAYRDWKLKKVAGGDYAAIDNISPRTAQANNKPDLAGIDRLLPSDVSRDSVAWEITKKGTRPHAEYVYKPISKAGLQHKDLSGYSKIVKSLYCVESELPEAVQTKLREADESTIRRPERKGTPVHDRTVYFKRPKEVRDLDERPSEELTEKTFLYLR